VNNNLSVLESGQSKPTFLYSLNIGGISRNVGFSLIFSLLLINFFVAYLGIDFWSDIRAYEQNFGDVYYYYQAINPSFMKSFTSEVLWLYIVQYLMTFNITVVQALYVLSVISCTLIANFVLLSTKRIYSLLLLINPIFIDFVIGQVRSSLAISLVLTSFLVRSEALRFIIIVMSSAIHFGSALFGAMYYIYFFGKRFDVLKRLMEFKSFVIVVSGIIALSTEIWRTVILTALGDRRATTLVDFQSSPLLAVGWLLFLGSYAFTGRDRQSSFVYFFFSTNALLFFVSTFNGNYASRYVAVAFPMLCVLQSNQPLWGKWVFAAHMVAFAAIYSTFWIH
jgi:hypothetical protein